MSGQEVIESILRVSLFCVLIGVVLASSGCSTLPLTQNQALPATAAASQTQKQAPQGVYEVQLSGGFSKPTTSRGVIDGPITVQTVLERSGAIDKFRNMEITILRVVKDSGRGLKLKVDFNGSKDAVPPEQDYAIHPNDRILVESKSGGAIDRLVETVAR